MNYRHGFHAGNHADVLKHVVLLGVLDALQRKPGALCVFDTHAGRGRYPLASEQARRTGEAATGIERLRQRRAAPDPVQRYLAAVAACEAQFACYPGSPQLIADQLREHDRLVACELHPEEAEALRIALGQRLGVVLHERSGYEALPALSPPAERRGLVLMDPPYELQLDEFGLIETCLERTLQRWPAAVIALWYPIKQRRVLRPALRRLSQLPAKQVLDLQLLIRDDDSPLRLNGSGMLLLNPPWQIEQSLGPALQWLGAALGEPGASSALQWLKTETS